MGCLNKILAKVLAKRLKKVLEVVIDQRQSAFLGGRQLLHSVLVANKVVDDAKRRKKNVLYSKLILKRHMTQ